ncbi:MAG TPA: 2OG-Fe(II) oxygenase family protein [Albitalea sp.]|uniref:isopenicillin N synthase family dioxygenase n=1 Tax=Piscinibacter sp. TaxID=1903157 RepID=UPI002ED23FE1
MSASHWPVIDVAPLVDPSSALDARRHVGRALDDAARRHGFFYAVAHHVDPTPLATLARRFFAQDEAVKQRIPMSAGGPAWRGYFALGGELTSNRPDWKEGLYLGRELPPEHPRVRAGTILHGANLWPDIAGFRETVLAYLDAMTSLGQALMRGFASGLGLPEDHFRDNGTADPLILLRLFNYPSRPVPADAGAQWGVGEHTDYGLLTMLWQDDVGGLQVRTGEGWVDVPPLPDSFVCNVGDMLDRITGGRYRSVPHRVTLNTSGRDRLSIPFFFDPDFNWQVQPVPGSDAGADDSGRRWDGANLQAFEGRYGEYVAAKVGKVFPELRRGLQATLTPDA